MSDEGATHTNGLFLTETHAEKIDYSCTNYSRKAAPGSRWVYHTSDTYILGTAMNARLKALEGTGADIHADTLLGDILLPLGVSRTRSEEHTSELQSLMRISYAVFCLKKN